jgi:hypothetical protein
MTLDKLVSRIARKIDPPPPPVYKPPNPWPSVMLACIGYHLGGYRQDGQKSIAECSPLGFESYASMQKSIHGAGDDFNEYYRAGVAKLLASRGASLDGDPDKRDLIIFALIDEADKAGVPMPDIPG